MKTLTRSQKSKVEPGNANRLCRSLAVVGLAAMLLIAPAGRADTIYVTGDWGQIIKFTSDGTRSVFGDGAGQVTGGLAIDSAGNVYWADQYFSRIFKFTPDGVRSVFASTGLIYPSGLAFDSAGNLYAANYDNTILKFTPDGIGSVFATGLNGPLGLAVDRQDNLYVANFSNASVSRFTPDGVGSVFANTGLRGPYGLAFNNAGDLYVANDLSHTIVKFTPDGIGSLFASTVLTNPCGLAFDSAGNLYAANQSDGTIAKFTPDGAGTVFATGFRNGPVYIAIHPEPVVLDGDGDGVPDDVDQCPGSASGSVVDGKGCTIDQLVPCRGPASGGTWKNHGQYVSAISKTAEAFAVVGLLTSAEKDAVVRAAARSNCGTK